jgi:hypothetical protein
MKTLKALCTSAILALILSVSTYAGDILTPGSPSPAPGTEPTSTSCDSTSSGCSTSADTSETLGLDDLLSAILSVF